MSLAQLEGTETIAMLNILERTVFALSLLAVLAVGALVLIGGPPSTVPFLEVQANITTEPLLEKSLNAEQKAAMREQQDAAQEARKESGKGGGAKSKPTKVEYRKVSKQFLERVENETGALQELRSARSEVVEDGAGLKIFDFESTCLLPKLGFEENDVIRMVGGKQIDWSSELDKRALYYEGLAKSEQGIPVVVDFERNGKPMQMVISLDQ